MVKVVELELLILKSEKKRSISNSKFYKTAIQTGNTMQLMR